MQERETRHWLEDLGLRLLPTEEVAPLLDNPLRNGTMLAALATVLTNSPMTPGLLTIPPLDVRSARTNILCALDHLGLLAVTWERQLRAGPGLAAEVEGVLAGSFDSIWGLLNLIRLAVGRQRLAGSGGGAALTGTRRQADQPGPRSAGLLYRPLWPSLASLPYSPSQLAALEASLLRWLAEAGAISVREAAMGFASVLSLFADGTLICWLVSNLSGQSIKGAHQRPRAPAARRSNWLKAIAALRSLPGMSRRCLGYEEALVAGERPALTGLLEDLHRAATGVEPVGTGLRSPSTFHPDSQPYLPYVVPEPVVSVLPFERLALNRGAASPTRSHTPLGAERGGERASSPPPQRSSQRPLSADRMPRRQGVGGVAAQPVAPPPTSAGGSGISGCGRSSAGGDVLSAGCNAADINFSSAAAMGAAVGAVATPAARALSRAGRAAFAPSSLLACLWALVTLVASDLLGVALASASVLWWLLQLLLVPALALMTHLTYAGMLLMWSSDPADAGLEADRIVSLAEELRKGALAACAPWLPFMLGRALPAALALALGPVWYERCAFVAAGLPRARWALLRQFQAYAPTVCAAQSIAAYGACARVVLYGNCSGSGGGGAQRVAREDQQRAKRRCDEQRLLGCWLLQELRALVAPAAGSLGTPAAPTPGTTALAAAVQRARAILKARFAGRQGAAGHQREEDAARVRQRLVEALGRGAYEEAVKALRPAAAAPQQRAWEALMCLAVQPVGGAPGATVGEEAVATEVAAAADAWRAAAAVEEERGPVRGVLNPVLNLARPLVALAVEGFAHLAAAAGGASPVVPAPQELCPVLCAVACHLWLACRGARATKLLGFLVDSGAPVAEACLAAREQLLDASMSSQDLSLVHKGHRLLLPGVPDPADLHTLLLHGPPPWLRVAMQCCDPLPLNPPTAASKERRPAAMGAAGAGPASPTGPATAALAAAIEEIVDRVSKMAPEALPLSAEHLAGVAEWALESAPCALAWAAAHAALARAPQRGRAEAERRIKDLAAMIAFLYWGSGLE
ncbi:hypothetical protein GPECTOR_11g210 [Gonium pectorale]|uniref:Calponin-homology (CH) domain-containing protein n=1 Tax=Gonium pectorale TaxID=33097 RepID=A0A150GPK7_GONPE|nr:hypothetical protein GPECTOR_11g210 [Gonium pectorale]|eukprot:KXZ51767.1 hypothetical protein GPECTOR_11g210 [Gonium pectorale]